MTEEHEHITFAGHSDAFYQRPEEDDRVYMSTSEIAWLLRQEHILECLMKCGVHNAEMYEAAMKLHKETYV